MRIVIFDIEVFSNYFLILFRDRDTNKDYVFEIFNDTITEGTIGGVKSIYKLCYLVGYNSNQFDVPLLEYVLNICKNGLRNTINKDIYDKAQSLITSKSRSYNNNNQSIDLMELCFNVSPKSLKLIGCSLKMPKLQDLPLPYDSVIEESQLQLIREYCENDIDITEALYNHKTIQEALVIRKAVQEEYGITGLLSKSDSAMGNVLCKRWYAEGTGLEESQFNKQQTDRGTFLFKEALFPDIANSFTTIQGKRIVKHLSELQFDSSKQDDKKKAKYPSFKAFGLILQYGAGGLHSKDAPEFYNVEHNPSMTIRDWDIDSEYPTICINYNVNPAHLSKVMIDKYRTTRDERLALKANGLGKTPKANSLKLVLNSYVGKFSSKFSFLRDDLCNLQVTLNGQLLITKIVEVLYVNGFKVISVNTDGLVTIVPKDRTVLYELLINDFAKQFNITGEFNEYVKYIRKDVNNYLSVTKKDVKVKGIFESKIDITKGYKYPIIKIALLQYYLNDGVIPVEKIIKEHKDIYDFCIAQKVGKQFTVFYGEDKIQQSVRCYVSLNGKEITKHKIVKDKKTGEDKNSVTTLLKDKLFTLFNDYFEVEQWEDYQIDYSFYIEECQKVINKIKEGKL